MKDKGIKNADRAMATEDFLGSTAQKYFGVNYLFPYQRLVVTNILEAADAEGFKMEPSQNPVTGVVEILDTRPHQIVILPTGAGKSLCFMLPIPLIEGATLILFPLLSLMADQARRLIESGFSPAILRGGQSRKEREKIFQEIKAGKTRVILSNPETILQKNILSRLKDLGISHLVIDEMHIVSEWGDTFRPAYLEVSKIYLEGNIKVVTAFTATASPVILSRVKEILFPKVSPAIISANPDRPNIRYRLVPSISKNIDLAVLTKEYSRPLIVFNRSRTGAELTARYLRRKLGENEIFFYHAGLSPLEKKKIEKWFFDSKEGILSSTCAYGLGVDKGNIRTVIHIDPPPSVEAYLQESGRAGRDKQPADAILILSKADFAHAAAIKNTILKNRYLSFLRAVSNNKQCRRKSLLLLLGAQNDNCSGCDVCSKSVKTKASGSKAIVDYIKKLNRKTTMRQAVLTLGGKKYPEVFANFYNRSKFYKSLGEWTEEDIKEGILTLKETGVVRIPKHGPYKKLLVYNGHSDFNP